MSDDRLPEARDLIVTEPEGMVLGHIARRQPVTRYQVLRAFQRSPLTIHNTSKGSLYPLVRRMLARGLLLVEAGGATRGTEGLRLTERGYEALRLWVRDIALQHILLSDPVKMRALSLGELTREDRVRWIARTKALILEKKEEFKVYNTLVRLPYRDLIIHSYAKELDGKLEFLDRLLIKVVNEGEPERAASYAWEDKSRRGDRSPSDAG